MNRKWENASSYYCVRKPVGHFLDKVWCRKVQTNLGWSYSLAVGPGLHKKNRHRHRKLWREKANNILHKCCFSTFFWLCSFPDFSSWWTMIRPSKPNKLFPLLVVFVIVIYQSNRQETKTAWMIIIDVIQSLSLIISNTIFLGGRWFPHLYMWGVSVSPLSFASFYVLHVMCFLCTVHIRITISHNWLLIRCT